MSSVVCDREEVMCRGHSSVYKYGADGPVGTSKWTHHVHREKGRSGVEERQALETWFKTEVLNMEKGLRYSAW